MNKIKFHLFYNPIEMYKTVLFLIAFLICLNPKSWATPIPPGPYLNVSIVSSNESNNACVGEQIQLSPVFENPEMLEFLVGDIGPGSNGTVFFDKGNDSDGWRYLQLASFDIIIPDSINTGFGCDCENVDADNIGPGSGFDNFLEWKSSPCASDLIQYIDELNIVGFDDWYIPSKDELNLLYAFLLNQNSVFIEPFLEGYYWSSSPAAFGDCGNNGGVFQKSMISGAIQNVSRNDSNGKIRLIRRFSNRPSFLWSTGHQDSTLYVSNDIEGTVGYSVQVGAYHNVWRGTHFLFPGVSVYYYNSTSQIDIQYDYDYLAPQNSTLIDGDSILFNGNYIKESGVYSDTSTNSDGCRVITQLNLQVLPIPLKCRIDVSYCAGDLQKLSLFADPPDSPGNPLSIQWSTGATTPQITLEPNASGIYSVTVSDDVQSCTASIQIQNP